MCNDHAFAPSRRMTLAAGLGLASAAFLGGLALPVDAFAQEAAPNAISPDEALKRLMDGNGRYTSNNMKDRDFSAGRAARAKAQYPFAGLVSCADSRVPPELAFDQGPGELFVVRLAGNFVNVDGLASLEYGVKFFGMPLIMVLGHTNCGAVDAAIKVVKDNISLPGHLDELIGNIRPAIESTMKENPPNLLEAAITANVRYNVKKLSAATPIISEYVGNGKLKIVGAVYDLSTSKVTLV